MPPILFANGFLASSLLTLLLPICLLIAIAVWYVLAVKRVPGDTPQSSAALPASDVVAAAADTVNEVTPAGPPPGEIS
jgi:hypothetical protein